MHTRERPFWLDASRRASCSSSLGDGPPTLFLSTVPARHESLHPFHPPRATLRSPLLLRVSPLSLRFTRLFLLFVEKEEKEKERKEGKKEDQGEYVHRRGNQRGRCIFVGTLPLPPPRNAPALSRYARNTRERCRTIVSGALKFSRLHAPVDPPYASAVPSAAHPLAS